MVSRLRPRAGGKKSNDADFQELDSAGKKPRSLKQKGVPRSPPAPKLPSKIEKIDRKNAKKPPKSSGSTQRPVKPSFQEPRSGGSSPLSDYQSVTSPSQLKDQKPAATRKKPTSKDLLKQNEQLKARISALESAMAEERRSNNALQVRATGNLALHFEETAAFSPTRTPPKSPAHKSPPPPPRTSPPPVSPGKLLLKRDGKRIMNEQEVAVIPQAVDDGEACNEWPATRAPFSKGLRNPGNFCYRNAMLQALFHVPAFYRHLGLMHKDCIKQNQECIVCALQYLAQNYWNSQRYRKGFPTEDQPLEGPRLTLDSFNRACRADLPTTQASLRRDICNGAQSEASEFAKYLLDEIHGKELPTDGATFRKTLELEYKVRWICQDCHEVHDRQVPDGDTILVVQISGDDGPGDALPLTTYLNRSHNDLSERRCESEECKREGRPGATGDGIVRSVTRRITHAPDVLIVWINRYWQDTTKRFAAGKIFDDIHFKEYLDLRHLADQGPLLYRLDGVVAHRGPTTTYGHYISAVRKVDHDGDDEFHTINDDTRLRQHRDGSFFEMRFPASERTQATFLEVDDYEEECFWPSVLVYSKVT